MAVQATKTADLVGARPVLGVVAMLLNTLMIPFMGVIIKKLTELNVGTLEMLAMRSWITLGLLLPLLFFYNNFRAVKAADIKAHAIHASFTIITMACFYYALRTLPIVTVTAINFTTPIFVLIFARVLFGERVAPLGWVAMLIGFGGTLVVLRPDASGIELASLVVLFGSITGACMNLAVRRMPARSTNYAVLFYFSLAGAIVYGAAGAPVITTPQPQEWIWFIALASIALAVHTCTTVAYRVASSMLIGALDYVRIIWAMLIGYVFVAEVPVFLDGVGVALIVLSGVIVLRLNIAKLPPRAPQPL
jgi:drug/metabolite transporter (DMT)-like permease